MTVDFFFRCSKIIFHVLQYIAWFGYMEKDRRNRVDRIKKYIVFIISLAILIPCIICGILLYKVHTLKARLATAEQMIDAQEKEINRNSLAADPMEVIIGEGGKIEEAGEATSSQVSGTQGSPFGQDALTDVDSIDETEPYRIYLTFDDGPSENTEAILTVLREYGVKATFFVNGRTALEDRQLYKRITDAGHTIGMHSYSHKYSEIYSSEERFTDDFHEIRNLIYQETGVMPVYYRFPGGSSNSLTSASKMRSYIDILHSEGVEYIDWNVECGDAKGRGYKAEDIVNNIFNNFGKYHTNVVLLHDGIGHEATVEALPMIIQRARNMGAELMPVTEDMVPIQHLKDKSKGE